MENENKVLECTDIERVWQIKDPWGLERRINYHDTEERKWDWIGHTLHKETGEIEKTVLDWNHQEYRRRNRLKRTWQRTIADEIGSARRSWKEVKGIAGDRNAW